MTTDLRHRVSKPISRLAKTGALICRTGKCLDCRCNFAGFSSPGTVSHQEYRALYYTFSIFIGAAINGGALHFIYEESLVT